MADRENRRLISRDTIFRLYSQTKPVTAACAMILMERGLLDPGEFVSEYLPSYSELKQQMFMEPALQSSLSGSLTC